jgi:hypothetical protein
MAASAAIMAGALIVSAPWSPSLSAAALQVQTLMQPAQPESTPAPPAPISFLVRFRGSGPIARAQAMAADGDETQAARLVQVQLERQRAFHGLCFDRFTIGGAEIVLRSCMDVPPSERAAFQTRWLARLNAMRAVEYADANTAAAPARTQ